MKFSSFLIVFVFSVGAFAVPDQYVLQMFNPMIKSKWVNSKSHINENCAQSSKNLNGMLYKLCEIKTRNGLKKTSPDAKIRYTRFYIKGAEYKRSSKGSIVIAPGRAESSLKYIEVAYDFLKRGYSPVYAIDHRSQGASSRTLPNKNKVNTANFYNYVNDFKDFVNKVVQTDKGVNQDRLFLISNSMGGAITALYLEEVQDHPFDATAMFGAMHKIEYPRPYTEFLAQLISNVVCTTGGVGSFQCTKYAPGRGEDFDESQRVFDNNPLTHSWNRYEMRNELWRTRPYLATGGVTFRWIQSSTNVARKLRRNAHKIKIPILVVTASADPIVDPKGHRQFCNNAPRCVREIANTSRHEVLMEKDSIRNNYMGQYYAPGKSRGGRLFEFLDAPESYIGH